MPETTAPTSEVEHPNKERIQELIRDGVVENIFEKGARTLWEKYFREAGADWHYTLDTDALKDEIDMHTEWIATASMGVLIRDDQWVEKSHEEKVIIFSNIHEAVVLYLVDAWEKQTTNIASNISIGSAAMADVLKATKIEPNTDTTLSDKNVSKVLEKSLELSKSIDKTSEGWEAILDAREALSKEFLEKVTADNWLDTDTEKFVEMLKTRALQAASRFPFENPISYEDCLLLIMTEIDYNWNNTIQRAQGNADRAINAGFREIDLSGAFDPVPGFNTEK